MSEEGFDLSELIGMQLGWPLPCMLPILIKLTDSGRGEILDFKWRYYPKEIIVTVTPTCRDKGKMYVVDDIRVYFV